MIRTLSIALSLAVAPVQAAATARSDVVIETQTEVDGTVTLVHEIVVPAPVGSVWNAVSTAQGWKSWAVPVAWIDPEDADVIETSYDPAAARGSPQTIRQRFLARIPGRMLAFKTIKAPAGFTDFDQFAHMLSVFELEQVAEGATRVRLTGVGYPDTEAGRRLLDFFRGGNRVSLEMLRDRFANGPIDWTEKLKKPLK
jgi:uncharacterized protein YndB with AHSA1/START domain